MLTYLRTVMTFGGGLMAFFLTIGLYPMAACIALIVVCMHLQEIVRLLGVDK